MIPAWIGRVTAMRLLDAGLCAALSCTVGAQAADDFVVEAQARGSAVAIDARATLSVPHAVIWATLTDYNRFADFIPGMRSSRIAERRGPVSIVEQQGEAGFFIFSYDIAVVVAATEHPPNVIEVSALRGNLKRLDGRYQIEPGTKPGALVLRWTGLIEPEFSLPAFISVPLIRSNIEDQFRGMVDEIERRDAPRRMRAAAKGAQ